MIELPNDFSDKRICVLGLGYVGLTLAVAMARVGFHVHGLEVQKDIITSLSKHKAHFWEKNLDINLNQTL